jgi:hypothetical protein
MIMTAIVKRAAAWLALALLGQSAPVLAQPDPTLEAALAALSPRTR